jgi:hypothetical protein
MSIPIIDPPTTVPVPIGVFTPIPASEPLTGDVTHTLNLPADPPTDVRSSLRDLLAGTGFVDGTMSLPTTVPTELDAPTVPHPVAPSVSLDASGTPHVTIPLTKKTKAIIGTCAAAVAFIGLDVTAYLPDTYKGYALGVITVAGGIATWMGIAVPTNLPINFKK